MTEPWNVPIDDLTPEQPRVTIEMGGSNIVIRSTSGIDRSCTSTLAHAVNAAADTNTAVVIDPEPIRCDDTFAAYRLPGSPVPCSEHVPCGPVDAEVVRTGIIEIQAEHTTWTIDVSRGRFCQSEAAVDVRFLDPAAWTPVIAICVTRTKLCALSDDGTLITSNRAHHVGVPAAPV
jgi:hypothetical protein